MWPANLHQMGSTLRSLPLAVKRLIERFLRSELVAGLLIQTA
jgi:hypothetical protein